MKSSETVGDIPGKKNTIHQWNFFRYSLSLLHLSIRRVFSEVFCTLPGSLGAWATGVPARCWPPQLLGPELPPCAGVSTGSPGLPEPMLTLHPASHSVALVKTKTWMSRVCDKMRWLVVDVESAPTLGFRRLSWVLTAQRSVWVCRPWQRERALLPVWREVGEAAFFPFIGFLEILPKFIPSYLKIKKRNTFFESLIWCNFRKKKKRTFRKGDVKSSKTPLKGRANV